MSRSCSLRLTLLLVCLSLFIPSCKRHKEAPKPAARAFPMMQVPGAITGDLARLSWMSEHYWDAYLDTTVTALEDSTHFIGVGAEDLEKQVGTFVTLAEALPVADGAKAVEIAFASLCAYQANHSESGVYEKLTELLSRYLYDPNSPVRNEDLYLPLAAGLARSSLTDEGMRDFYGFQAKMCSLNRFGTRAADFACVDLKGRRHSLYGIKAPYTLLFFSNPGCASCKEIISALSAEDSPAATLHREGRLAILNVYIDSDLDAWREYAVTYPSSWINAYDPDYVIRTDLLYNVRAIPSLYLLDDQKNVLMKDAPAERLLSVLDKLP